MNDIDTKKQDDPESEPVAASEPEPKVEAGDQPPGEQPGSESPDTSRRGPATGIWVAVAVGAVVMVVAAGLIGYFVGRNSDTGGDEASGAADTARTDQKVCTELLGAQQEIALAGASAAPPEAVADAMRTHVAGVLSDAPPSAVTSAVQDSYHAAVDAASGDPAARSTYDEKMAIAQYQCNKIATWDWPPT